MLAHVLSAALRGIDAFPVSVEVDVTFGLPVFAMVGLPDASVRESRDRVRAAIRNSGFDFPPHRITVNLAPADVRKAGAAFDLPIAVAILAAAGVVPDRDARRLAVVGELSLDGAVLPTRGILPVAAGLRRLGIEALMLPHANAAEASVVAGLAVVPVRTLAEAVACLQQAAGRLATRPRWRRRFCPPSTTATGDLLDVRGQATARRALEVAAAGGHHLLFVGPPGAGKTMLARRLPGVLPPLTFEEALEATAVHSVAGLLAPGVGLLGARPFRAPHHTASEAALVGGGSQPRPGEVTLAHHGVLFLDELPEFGRRVLESLRQPLEEGQVRISRASGTVTFPAAFTLVAAMNPCPCGFAGQAARVCRCTPLAVQQYYDRVSGPLRDRLDLTVELAPVPFDALTGGVCRRTVGGGAGAGGRGADPAAGTDGARGGRSQQPAHAAGARTRGRARRRGAPAAGRGRHPAPSEWARRAPGPARGAHGGRPRRQRPGPPAAPARGPPVPGNRASGTLVIGTRARAAGRTSGRLCWTSARRGRYPE